ncbi:hypothetical protein Pla52o_27700 [Novipirellula galeiformis]|uniref:Uncharacterized protein n=1 Tax=Novipirellula galeiformis TaxID=2528004 RepID=A0A5C6CIB5_9BACT|nr:hypothetical protein Pla52o_27700 [Novipirellula galeiformis]
MRVPPAVSEFLRASPKFGARGKDDEVDFERERAIAVSIPADLVSKVASNERFVLHCDGTAYEI